MRSQGRLHSWIQKFLPSYNQGMARVLNLTAWVIREGEEFVSICPELDVSSCGSTAEEARRMLNEALEGFLEVASDEEIERRLANPVGFSEAITIQ